MEYERISQLTDEEAHTHTHTVRLLDLFLSVRLWSTSVNSDEDEGGPLPTAAVQRYEEDVVEEEEETTRPSITSSTTVTVRVFVEEEVLMLSTNQRTDGSDQVN